MKSNKIILFILIILTLFTANLHAGKVKVGLRGWVEDKLSIYATEYKPGDTRELRLITDGKMNSVLSFNSHLYGRVFLGEDAVNEKYTEVLIDRALLSCEFSKARVRIGRQRLAWGTGFIWNPTDIFNDVILTDLKYTRKGKDAVEVVYYPGDLSELTCLVTFSSATFLQDDRMAIKGKTNIQGYDISLSLITQTLGEIDMIGMDIAGTFMDLFGLRAELLQNFDRQNKRDISIGLDYSLNEYVYAFFEYFRNELTYNNIPKNNFYIGMSDIINELLTIGAGFVIGADLALLSTNAEYSLSDDTYLTLSLNFFSGGFLNTHYIKVRFNF